NRGDLRRTPRLTSAGLKEFNRGGKWKDERLLTGLATRKAAADSPASYDQAAVGAMLSDAIWVGAAI
ncbi:MAG: hypothetical protein WCB11_26730, partial [Terriglobales bacterium]